MTKNFDYCPYLTDASNNLLNKLYIPTSESKFDHSILDENKFKSSIHVNTQNEAFMKSINYKELQISVPDLKKLKEKHLKIIKGIKDSKKIPKDKIETHIKTENTKYKRIVDNINNVRRAKKFWIPITKKQKEIIFGWFKLCDFTYNKCVTLFNDGEFNKLTKVQLFNMIFDGEEKNCPYDMLSDEYKKFKSNLKSVISNMRNGNITHFQMTNKKQNNGRSVFIAKPGITKFGIYPNLLGNIPNFDKIININLVASDCMLVYDKLKKAFYLHIPQYIHIKEIKNRSKVVALDPGEKIFMAFYSPELCGKIGEDIRINILRYQSDIKKLQKIKSNGINKENNKLKNKKHIQERINKKYRKIRYLVDELHHLTALYLCKNYDRILIPIFETQKMIKKDKEIYKGTPEEIKERIKEGSKKIRLSRRVKFVLNMLSHYRFRQHLIAKGGEYGCQIIECTEEYTTQCCGKCGYLSKVCENRVKICQRCEYRINRDINGARNIMIKNHEMIIEPE